jgi:4-carboxymuconolactone decarboxylase
MREELTQTPEVTIDISLLPRIEPLSYEDAEEETRAQWDQMAAASPATEGPRIDTQHAVFRTLMHHPDLFKVHSPYTQYLKNSTILPARHREIAIMRSAWNCGVDDQWVNHTAIGLNCGLSEEDIGRIATGAAAPGWSPFEAILIRAVDQLHHTCRVSDDTWASLVQEYDKRQLIEFLLLVGNYRSLSYIQNNVGIRPVTGTSPNIPGNRFLFPAP